MDTLGTWLNSSALLMRIGIPGPPNSPLLTSLARLTIRGNPEIEDLLQGGSLTNGLDRTNTQVYEQMAI